MNRRRYYVTRLDVAHQHRDLFNTMAGAHYLCLYDPAKPGAKEAWEAAGKPVLMNATFRLEAHADRWHEHPDVAILPDHVEEGTHTLESHLVRPTRKLTTQHIGHLASIGITGGHTVIDLEREAVKRNRSMKLRSVL